MENTAIVSYVSSMHYVIAKNLMEREVKMIGCCQYSSKSPIFLYIYLKYVDCYNVVR